MVHRVALRDLSEQRKLLCSEEAIAEAKERFDLYVSKGASEEEAYQRLSKSKFAHFRMFAVMNTESMWLLKKKFGEDRLAAIRGAAVERLAKIMTPNLRK